MSEKPRWRSGTPSRTDIYVVQYDPGSVLAGDHLIGIECWYQGRGWSCARTGRVVIGWYEIPDPVQSSEDELARLRAGGEP